MSSKIIGAQWKNGNWKIKSLTIADINVKLHNKRNICQNFKLKQSLFLCLDEKSQSDQGKKELKFLKLKQKRNIHCFDFLSIS